MLVKKTKLSTSPPLANHNCPHELNENIIRMEIGLRNARRQSCRLPTPEYRVGNRKPR